MGKLADRVQRRALRGAFKYADVVPVQVGHFGEFLLGNTPRKAELAQLFPKELSLLFDSHE